MELPTSSPFASVCILSIWGLYASCCIFPTRHVFATRTLELLGCLLQCADALGLRLLLGDLFHEDTVDSGCLFKQH